MWTDPFNCHFAVRITHEQRGTFTYTFWKIGQHFHANFTHHTVWAA
jgi:hypothetical protein